MWITVSPQIAELKRWTIASLGDAEYLITGERDAAHSGRGWIGSICDRVWRLSDRDLKKLGAEISR